MQQDIDVEAMNAVTVGVNLPRATPDPRLKISSAESASDALRLVRLLDAELLVTAATLPDGDPLQMIRKLRRARPWQKWVLASDELSAAEEIEARTLGVSAIVGAQPDVASLLSIASTVRRARLQCGLGRSLHLRGMIRNQAAVARVALPD